MEDKDVRSLMNLLRKRMNVTEGWNLWEIILSLIGKTFVRIM